MSAALQQPQPDRAELQQAVRRLTRTVDHLLDATRLESGLLQPVREWCDPGELLREAVALAGLKEAQSKSTSPQIRRPFLVDAHLIQQALALYFRTQPPMEKPSNRSKQAWRATIRCSFFPSRITGRVLRPGEENKVFEKFYRGPGTRCRAVWASAFPSRGNWSKRTAVRSSRRIDDGGGARFSIRLPHRRTNAAADRKRPHETGRAHHR